MKNADMPAMPVVDPDAGYPLDVSRYGSGLSTGKFASGLTKREMMELNFMAALIAQGGYHSFDLMAKDAVNAASALIAEQERTCQKS